MIIPTWVKLSATLALIAAYGAWCYHAGAASARADAAEQAVEAWAERFALQAQLATRDQQLADSQALAAQKRTEIVIKREVIYREKIKDVAVRDCVADSGLFELYNSTLGVTGGQQ